MATEAEIIPEPISVLKAEEDIIKPSSDLNKPEVGLAMLSGTDKANNVESATNNGVETLSIVSQGNPEMSKGESFSKSPEVSDEAGGMPDHSRVDDTPFEAEKIPEDDEKVSKIKAVAEPDSSLEEKRESNEEEISQNPDIESNNQEGNLEIKKQDLIGNPDPVTDSLNEANEIVTEAGHSDLVQEKLEEKTLEELKETEAEKLPATVGKEEGTEATDLIETSISEKDQIISESTGDTLTSKAAEISEVAEKELENENPHEATCTNEPATQVDEKLEEESKEPETEQQPIANISNSSVSDETVKESTKEDESIPLELTEKASSSLELEDLKKDTEEKTLLEGSTGTADTESAPPAEETDNVVPTEEKNLAKTGHEVVGIDGADIDVKPAESSVSCEKDKEITREEDGMQDKVPCENTLPQAADEVLSEKADNPTLDVEPNVQTEQETGKCISVAETLQDEQSSDLGLEKEKIGDVKLSDEATDSGETSSTSKDVEKVIQEVKQETDVPEGTPEMKNMNANKGQSEETNPEPAKNLADETVNYVQEEETEKKINEELEDKPEDEQNANEVTKAVILSEEVEDKSSVSNECLKEADTKEQVEAQNTEVKEHSIADREASVIIESEEKKEDQVSVDPAANVRVKGESEEKIEDIVNDSKEDCHEESDETVTKVVAETSLDNTDDNEELVNVSSAEKSLDTSENDSNLETKEVENPKYELETSEVTLESEVNEVEQTKAATTEIALEPEVNKVEQTKAAPTEIALEPEVNKVEQTKAVPTELAPEPEVNEVEQTKAVPTELALEPEVYEVEQTKALPRELALEPEVNEVEQTKAVPPVLASEPVVNEVEQTKVVPTELASEPEVEQTKAVPPVLTSEPVLHDIEQTKVVPTELTSEPEVNEVEQIKAVPTELSSEPEVIKVEQTQAVPETSSECLSQSVQTSTATLPSEDQEIKTVHLMENIEEDIPKDAEIAKHESTIEEPKVVSVGETKVDQGLQNEEPEDRIPTTTSTLLSKDELPDAKQTAEICLEKEDSDEVEDGKKDETDATPAIKVEEPKDKSLASALPEAVVDHETTVSQASITEKSMEIETSALPSEEHETIETELKEDESPEKIEDHTTKVEGASNVEVETSEKSIDSELIKEVLEVKEVSETSSSTLEPEEPAKDGHGKDEVKDKHIEDKALETTQTKEDIVEEKQIVSEDKTVENQSLTSSVKATEEESKSESSPADPEGAVGSDNQISRELEPIENTEISPTLEEHVPVDLPQKIEESSPKAGVEDVKEVCPKEAEVKEKITDHSGEEITKESTSVEDSTKTKELKDEHTEEKTSETSEIPTYENQDEKVSVESRKDGANNNVEKEIVAEDQTVKDQEQAQVAMKEAKIVPGEEAMEKTEPRDTEPEKATEIDNGEEKTDKSGVEINPEPASAASGNISLSDLLERSEEEKTEVAERVIEQRELTGSKEEAPAEDAENTPAKEAKTDEVQEGDENNKTDSGSDAPVMVEAPKDTETKPHKKSQNILSGVGSKVKSSISKVRKAITGKSSSNSKEPKAISPKGGEK